MKNSLVRYAILTSISLCISFLLYGNTIPGEFVYDDTFFATREDIRQPQILIQAFTQPFNPANKETGGMAYRPVWVISLAANYLLFGSSPASFHVVNILLYAATLVALTYILERLVKNRALAYCIVLLFAVLPIHSEVIANIKSRDELLSLFLLLCSYILFIRAVYSKARDPQTYASALVYGLALLTKESVVLGPIIFMLIYRLSYKSSLSYMFKLLLPFFIVLAVYLGLRTAVLKDDAFLQQQTPFIQNPLSGAALPVQLSTAMKIAGIYLVKSVVPYNLTASYDFNHIPSISQPFASWESLVGMIGLLWLLYLALRSKEKTLRIGAIWFLVSYVIVSKILFNRGSLMGERSIYTPSVGLAVLYGYAVYMLCRGRVAILVPILSLIAAIYAGIIIPRNLVWRTPQGFFEQMVRDSPNSVQAHKALAKGYFDMGKLTDAKSHASRAYQLYANDVEVLVLLGKLAYVEQDYHACDTYTTKAIAQEKKQYDANHFHLLCMAKLGRYQEVLDLATHHLMRSPGDVNIRFVMAVSLYKMGKREDALRAKYNWAQMLSESELEKILQEF